MISLLVYFLWKIESKSLWELGVLLFAEFGNLVFILFYNSIEFIIMLYTILVTYFARYEKYMNCGFH